MLNLIALYHRTMLKVTPHNYAKSCPLYVKYGVTRGLPIMNERRDALEVMGGEVRDPDRGAALLVYATPLE